MTTPTTSTPAKARLTKSSDPIPPKPSIKAQARAPSMKLQSSQRSQNDHTKTDWVQRANQVSESFEDVIKKIEKIIEQLDELLGDGRDSKNNSRRLPAEFFSLKRECTGLKTNAEGFKKKFSGFSIALQAAEKKLVTIGDENEKKAAEAIIDQGRAVIDTFSAAKRPSIKFSSSPPQIVPTSGKRHVRSPLTNPPDGTSVSDKMPSMAETKSIPKGKGHETQPDVPLLVSFSSTTSDTESDSEDG